jgi:hypothetical protein
MKIKVIRRAPRILQMRNGVAKTQQARKARGTYSNTFMNRC